MTFILKSDSPADPRYMGGKAAALAELCREGLTIPPWFVITPAAFEQSLGAARRQQLLAAPDGGAMRDIVGNLLPCDDVIAAVQSAVAELAGGGEYLAVRSSAVDEDGADHSFAGQLESFLFVLPQDTTTRVVEVWRSGFADRVIAYRKENGLSLVPSVPAVLVQRMIDAEISGVAFAADPISGSRTTVVVSAVFGLGTALVGGDADCDTYRLDHSGKLLEQQIVRKSVRHVAAPESAQGVRVETVPDSMADQAALDSAQLRDIVELVLAVSRHRGRPQDIEWAIKAGKLYLLQARPITSLAGLADPDGSCNIWDNSNIAESYSGITTPLTFSFARRAYDGAYRQFCSILKVPTRVILDNDAMFSQMLGLIRGRVYYNLLNWYRLLAMLPGYSVNQRFMEQMMGVREGLPPEVSAGVVRQTWAQRQSARLRLAWSAAGLIWNHLVLGRKIRAFYARLNQALAAPKPPLQEMRLDQLAVEFRKLESSLVTRWDAPLINDFLAMIFFGVLGKLCAKWCGDNKNLQNDLIADEGGIISTEPARRISEMGRLAMADPKFVDALCDDECHSAETKLRENAALGAAYDAYLEKFGDRCLEELKLESTTLVDDPTPLLRSIGHTARRLGDASVAASPFHPREAAERQIAEALKGHWFRRRIFKWVLANARGRVRDRENLRFERTRLFGRVRRIFVEIGRRLFGEGRLADPRDVFYLTLDEILGFIEGTSTCESIDALSRLRRQQFDRYRDLAVPAERFQTRGAVYVGNRFEATSPTPAAGDAAELKGVGCCPGIVRGPVRVIRDPRGAHLRHGEILVAERTDPGWIMLFPAAAGVLVERGSLLSHSAIVAREMGIPAIVSIPGLTQALADGQWIEMNGSTGTILRVAADAVPPPGATS